MEITVFNKQSAKISSADLKKMAKKLSFAVINNLEANKPLWIKSSMLVALKQRACLNLIIVSKAEIKKLNKNWLGKNKVTDVLSFPLFDWRNLKIEKISGQAQLHELGEIFIAYEKACEQAKEYKHSVNRELAFLFVHGMLHIFGFDHNDKASEKDMFGRQREILIQAGYPR
jgi:probable rRNA maturation factor